MHYRHIVVIGHCNTPICGSPLQSSTADESQMYILSWCPRTTTRSARSLYSQRSVSRPCQISPPARHYASSATPRNPNVSKEVKNVAILGGGITGLATAFYLSKFLPEVRITLFEGSSRLGGWLHSKQVDVGNGHVVFEQGPRTLRPNVPNGLVTLKLVCLIISIVRERSAYILCCRSRILDSSIN